MATANVDKGPYWPPSTTSNGGLIYVVPLEINGREVRTDKTYTIRAPSSGELLWYGAAASRKEAIAAVEAAESAFPLWSKTTPSIRRDIFLNASHILARRADELSTYMDLETGSLRSFSRGLNMSTSYEQLRDVAGRIVTITGSVPVHGQKGRNALVYKEPYGVIFSIAPS